MEKSTLEEYLTHTSFQNDVKYLTKKNTIDNTDITSLLNTDSITNVKDILNHDLYHDDGSVFSTNIFIDQDNNIRTVETADDLILGMIEFYGYHKDIKDRLIKAINNAYHFERHGC